jgi:hypothetical protein
MRPTIVQRQKSLGPVLPANGGETIIDQVQGLIPGNAGEFAVTLGPNALEWSEETIRPMDKLRVMADLATDSPTRQRIHIGAANLNDLLVLDRDRQTARIGTI